MKTRHLSLIMFVMIIFLGLGLQPAHADRVNGAYIQNIKVQPPVLKVGDIFTVTTTLANNSTVPIWIYGGKCSSEDKQAYFFTIIFDNHAKIKPKDVFCAGVGWVQKIDPGKNITETSPDYTATYVAEESGTANAVITFSQMVINQTDPTQPVFRQEISKSFQFAISNQSASKPGNTYGGGPVVIVALDPLQQFKSGIAAKDVKCKEGLQLVIKTEDGSPACVTPQTAQKLIERGWAKEITGSTTQQASIIQDMSTNVCGQFYTAPDNPPNLRETPALLMGLNSTACAKFTFTVVGNFKDCNGPHCSSLARLDSFVHMTNIHYEKNDYVTSVTPAKDFTNSFKIKEVPEIVDLSNYSLGSKFTVTYIIEPLPNATGFYDTSIPKIVCDSYPLAVGYVADEVNASDFTYINSASLPCPGGLYQLTGIEISGMNYTEMKLP